MPIDFHAGFPFTAAVSKAAPRRGLRYDLKMHLDDLGTDPRTPGALPVAQIPEIVGVSRLACGEVRVVCDALIRDCPSGAVADLARRLRQQAIRLGQVATMLSTVDAGPDVLVWTRRGLPLHRRIWAAGRAAWAVLRG